MSGIIYAVILLALVAAFLLYRLIKLRREIRSISSQLEALVAGDTEKMLDITFVDKELERLAGLFNQYNDKQRMLVAGAMNDEQFLNDSVANISHDLRTPLTVILGHLQLMDRKDLTADQNERMDIVLNKAMRMKELVDAFYEYSLITTSKTELKVERFNVLNVLTELITESIPAMEEKGITPDIDLPEHSVYMESDRIITERIFQNLITNAIRYSAGDIAICMKAENKKMTVTISNPIPEDSELDPDRMFDRFYTGDASRNSGGTGLGLAVVKEFTNKLQGTVEAQREGNKLTIRLELPCEG